MKRGQSLEVTRRYIQAGGHEGRNRLRKGTADPPVQEVVSTTLATGIRVAAVSPTTKLSDAALQRPHSLDIVILAQVPHNQATNCLSKNWRHRISGHSAYG